MAKGFNRPGGGSGGGGPVSPKQRSCGSSQRPRLAQEPRVVHDQAERHYESGDGREQACSPVLPPVQAQAPDAEQHREGCGEKDQQRVDPAEAHWRIQ